MRRAKQAIERPTEIFITETDDKSSIEILEDHSFLEQHESSERQNQLQKINSEQPLMKHLYQSKLQLANESLIIAQDQLKQQQPTELQCHEQDKHEVMNEITNFKKLSKTFKSTGIPSKESHTIPVKKVKNSLVLSSASIKKLDKCMIIRNLKLTKMDIHKAARNVKIPRSRAYKHYESLMKIIKYTKIKELNEVLKKIKRNISKIDKRIKHKNTILKEN
jgi:hypothetical protein